MGAQVAKWSRAASLVPLLGPGDRVFKSHSTNGSTVGHDLPPFVEMHFIINSTIKIAT